MNRLRLWGAALLAGIAAIAAAFYKGRSTAKKEAENEKLNEYVKTRKAMDEVDIADDPSVLREWLRERGNK